MQKRLGEKACGGHLRRSNTKTAIFGQVNKHTPNTHHDPLEFPDSQIVLLTFLHQANKPRFFSFQHRLVLKLSNE